MSRHFYMGALAAFSIVAAIQDWLGLEGYIQHLRDTWIDLPWWISACTFVFAIWLGSDRSTNATSSADAKRSAATNG